MWKNSGWIGIAVLFCICVAFLMPQTRPKANKVAKNIIVWVQAKINGESTDGTGPDGAPASKPSPAAEIPGYTLLLNESKDIGEGRYFYQDFTFDQAREIRVKAYAAGKPFDFAIIDDDDFGEYLVKSGKDAPPHLHHQMVTKVDESGYLLPAGKWIVMVTNFDAAKDDPPIAFKIQMHVKQLK